MLEFLGALPLIIKSEDIYPGIILIAGPLLIAMRTT